MSSSINPARPRFPRKLVFVAILCLSLYLPGLLLFHSTKNAFSGVESGAKLPEQKLFGMDCILNGQAWFVASKRKAQGVGFEYAIKRLELKTGIIHETAIPKTDHARSVHVIDGELYVIDVRDIHKWTEDGLTLIGSFPFPPDKYCSNPFQYDHKFTLVARSPDDRFRLMHLVDHEWIDGREILLPNFRQIWGDEPEFTGTVQELNPRTELLQSLNLHVFHREHEEILFLSVASTFDPKKRFYRTRNLFRRGFEFIERKADVGPDQKIETRDATNWEVTTMRMPNGKTTNMNDTFAFIECDADGLIFAFEAPNARRSLATFRLARRGSDGQFRDLSGLNLEARSTLIVDPSDDVAYVMEESSDDWNSIAFRRIDGDTILPAFLTLEGGAHAYLVRWRHFSIGLLLAWVLHYVIAAAASACIATDDSRFRYESDMQIATISSVWRRIGASTIDLFGGVATLFALWYGIGVWSRDPWTTEHEIQLGDQLHALYHFAYECLGMLRRIELVYDDSVSQIFEMQLKAFADAPWFYASWFGSACILCGLKLGVEAMQGITLGKWILGIRTVNSNLARPGLIGMTIRTLLCPFEFLLFLSPLPAMACMMLTHSHRRLGDLCADTIVIKADSIHTAEWYAGPAETR